MKVAYLTLDGKESKAYLDDEPIGIDLYKGEDKWTDKPILLRSLHENGWIEIKGEN